MEAVAIRQHGCLGFTGGVSGSDEVRKKGGRGCQLIFFPPPAILVVVECAISILFVNLYHYPR